MALKIKKAETTPIRIAVRIPTDAGVIEGSFIGHAFVRSRLEQQELLDRITSRAKDQAQDDSDAAKVDIDGELVREIYKAFDGLENESGALTGAAAFDEVLRGQYSPQLTSAAIECFYAQIRAAERGNSAGSLFA